MGRRQRAAHRSGNVATLSPIAAAAAADAALRINYSRANCGNTHNISIEYKRASRAESSRKYAEVHQTANDENFRIQLLFNGARKHDDVTSDHRSG
ncbi:hypothetical protein V9T40_008236 [Parthenolecanium corni]|uniref:Uncharacterized protein n=1 Tax=Parthenolecanium corni TaxID=536013 RepID=A0AAN9TKI6_9HEMI